MPRGRPLTREQKEKIYHLHTMGVEHEEIADQFGISAFTVSRCVSRQREAERERRERRVSEVVVAGDKKNGRLVSTGTNKFEGTCLIKGKMKRHSFTASNANAAEEQWEQWRTRLKDEEAFMDMVERKPRHECDEHDVVVIEEAPKPAPSVAPVYVLWAKLDVPKLYGVYESMERAIDDGDRLNEVAAFLGSSGTFEVEEVVWR